MKKLALAAVLAAGMASSASAQAIATPFLGGLSAGAAVFTVIGAVVVGTIVSGETSTTGTN